MPDDPLPKPRAHPALTSTPGPAMVRAPGPAYAELEVTSNFTFLTGASHPDEMVREAARQGLAGIAITDTCTLAGVVRAHVAAKETGLPLLIGSRLLFEDAPGLSLLVYATDRPAYSNLCRLLTLGKRRTTKGKCSLQLADLDGHHAGLLAVAVPGTELDATLAERLERLRGVFDDDRLSLAASRLFTQGDEARLTALEGLSRDVKVPLVATNAVHAHTPGRRMMQDVLTCIRHGCTVQSAGARLHANAERHVKPPAEMARLFARLPRAVSRTAEILERARGFSLDELKYEYPDEVVPAGKTAMGHLADLSWAGAAGRYPRGVPGKVRAQILHELKLIDELKYAPYFLTVHELVEFAVSRGILCQGRGAAANSAVCYCLGVTAVDPDRVNVLFERFVSKERDEPPDIDIDFEHERREEVIQHLYAKYGRDRAALTAEVISYRGRSAVREVGKALGLSLDAVGALAKDLEWWTDAPGNEQRVRALGMNPRDPGLARVIALARELMGFPRHLSQHVGGFVITRSRLSDLVPIENAAMADRTVIEWDKDDIEALGMLKVDVLGLGMLTCLGRALRLVDEATERRSDEATKGTDQERNDHGRDQELSGSDCVAEGDGAGESDLRVDGGVAGCGEVRAEFADATGGRVDPVEHRGGVGTAEPAGLPQAPPDLPRIIDGTHDPVRARGVDADDVQRSVDLGPAVGDGSRASRTDPFPGAQGLAVDERDDAVQPCRSPPPSSLRRSVASSLDLSSLPPEDPAVYAMLARADTVGVFQVESRAQMSMLPRLRPRCYYDLVIEVAIVRPGPIQGKMVHPYLKRRNGEEPIAYASPEIERVLGRTLGVPLFQEQAMSLAVVAAGFTPGEADQLRRAIASWKRSGDAIKRFEHKLIGGMIARGHTPEFARQVFTQISGFSGYGFPESHAASFALIVYASAWLKRHHPAAFAAALINSQPMGFYQPAQIVRDAKEHGVEVREIDVNRSGWDCSLEEATERRSDAATEGWRAWGVGGPAIRLGLRLVKGLAKEEAEKIAAAVAERGTLPDIPTLWRASGCRASTLRRLAEADAFGSMGLTRQRALWAIARLNDERLPLFEHLADAHPPEAPAALPAIPAADQTAGDYHATGLSLKAHPVSFVRESLDARGVLRAGLLADEARLPHGTRAAVAGVVLVRQRPGTASGILFMTLEDETGVANLIVRPRVYERFRRAARHSPMIVCRGHVERQGQVVHVVARSIHALSPDGPIGEGLVRSRDFH